MKITFLGTGTSCGIPQMGCHCAVCTSTDPRDKRLRCSSLVQDEQTNLLVDCSPDFREQMLRIDFCEKLDAVLITHEHYDHVGGIDDLRPYSYIHDLPIYADAYSCKHLRERLPYCFVETKYPGVPLIQLCEMKEGDRIMFGDIPVTALQVIHGKLPILGFRIGDLGYITDMTGITARSINLLKGIKLLVVNGLRHEPHATHQTIEDAIGFSKSLAPDIPTYIIHMSHHLGLHAIEDALLPENIHLAYDGLVLEF